MKIEFKSDPIFERYVMRYGEDIWYENAPDVWCQNGLFMLSEEVPDEVKFAWKLQREHNLLIDLVSSREPMNAQDSITDVCAYCSAEPEPIDSFPHKEYRIHHKTHCLWFRAVQSIPALCEKVPKDEKKYHSLNEQA